MSNGTSFPTAVVDGTSYFYDDKVCVYRKATNTWECRTNLENDDFDRTQQTPGTQMTSQDVYTLRDSNGNLREKVLANLASKGLTRDVPALDNQYEFNHYLTGVLFEGQGGNVDLSSYALKSEIPTVPPAPDLSNYALKSEIPVVPPAPDLSTYALKSEIPVVPPAPDVSQFVTSNYVEQRIGLIPTPSPAPDLTPYALKSEIPTVPPAPDLTPYALKSEIPTVPSLQGYATTSYVEQRIAGITVPQLPSDLITGQELEQRIAQLPAPDVTQADIALAATTVDAKFDMLRSAIQESTDFATLKARLLAVLQ